MKNERYYYSILKPEAKKAYKIIYEGLRARSYTISVPLGLSLDDVQEVYIRVLYDNPYFYYVNQTVIRTQGFLGRWTLLPEYLYSATEIKTINSEIGNTIQRIKEKADKLRHDIFRMEKCLHDSVVKSVAYDYVALKKTDCFNAHSIVGAFLDNRAVCEGIAKAFKILCNEYDIKCIVVLGRANKDGDFSSDNDDDYHAWNLVKIGTESYHVDVTWDNLYDEELRHISYDYFNLTTKDILMDHAPIGDLPICDSTRLNYYHCTHSFVSTYDELVKLIERRFTNKEIVFKASTNNGYYLTTSDLKECALSAVVEVANRKGECRPFALLLNEKQRTGKIIFAPDDMKVQAVNILC